jgi:outer membrane receptor protein involved in Fe transport
MHISHRAMRITALAACASAASTLALAVEDTPVLEEVTVTATKTDAVSAQSAPFTLQAIGADELARGQIQGFDDYSKLIPGLASVRSGWRALTRLSVAVARAAVHGTLTCPVSASR